MSKKVKSEEIGNANIELAFQIAEKAKREAELVIANEEKKNRADELVIADAEKAKLEAELIIADIEKAKRAAELVIANEEKKERADELVVAQKDKANRADELVIAKADKAEREAELLIANEEKKGRADELINADIEKAKRADELVIAKADKAEREAELLIANREKTDRANELIIADIEKVKRADELVIAKAAKAEREAELLIATEDKEKQKIELIIIKIKAARDAAELIIANVDKARRAAELVIVNKELDSQNTEKERRKAKLVIEDVKKTKLAAELIIANIEKARLAAEFIIMNKKLLLAKGKIRNAKNLVIASKELAFQNKEKLKRIEELIGAKEKAEESDRLKTAFLMNMSHEIRTPMNGILGFSGLLQEPNLSSDKQQKFVQIIQKSGARMLNTINDIVDISKIEAGLIDLNMGVTNINEKIEFTYNFFKPEAEIKNLQLSYKNGLQSKEAVIKTDNEKVYGILTNLVKNAIKFTKEGSIELGYEKKGKYLEFFVKDTGMGIAQKQQEIIFERFRHVSESISRGYEGSGLGLSISKSYVEMLGGKIWLESKEGKGSIFYFTLPYNPVSEEKASIRNTTSEIGKEVQLKKLKILIVEDDEISYSLLTAMLEKISNKVLHAITGIKAVEACRKNPDIDLILMDIRMPGMDGNEATRQIRQFNKDVIIIAQTAYSFSGDKEKAIEAGCNSYITKPINKTALTELVKKHFIS